MKTIHSSHRIKLACLLVLCTVLAFASAPRERKRLAASPHKGEFNAAIDLENGEERSDPWLHFIEQYGLGRSGAVPEGIAFAIRQPWVATVRRKGPAGGSWMTRPSGETA